jgi:hypothetical protein
LVAVDPPQKRWAVLEKLVSDSPDFELIRRVSTHVELLLAVRSTEADAVVFFAETDEHGILSHLFAEYPDVRVLVLYPSGAAFIEERCPRRWPIADTSEVAILETLREAVEQPCNGPNRSELN